MNRKYEKYILVNEKQYSHFHIYSDLEAESQYRHTGIKITILILWQFVPLIRENKRNFRCAKLQYYAR